VLENKPKLILGGAAQKERKNEKGLFEAQKKLLGSVVVGW